MSGIHDRGGWPAGSIDQSEHVLEDWERRADALSQLLNRKGLRRTDESRRAIESMPPDEYENAKYYERWLFALETLMIEKGILTKDEIDQKMEHLDRTRGK